MNLFERFTRVAKVGVKFFKFCDAILKVGTFQANLSQLLNTLEDPEKVMTQAVVDLQSDLVKIRQSYAEVMSTQKKMEKQKVWFKRRTVSLIGCQEPWVVCSCPGSGGHASGGVAAAGPARAHQGRRGARAGGALSKAGPSGSAATVQPILIRTTSLCWAI